MANYNQNFQVIYFTDNLSYTGNTNSTIHSLVCLKDGKMFITALGGGSFEWTATQNDKIDVLIGYCECKSGNFIGFKSKQNVVQQISYK